jgi:hypothetical protein
MKIDSASRRDGGGTGFWRTREQYSKKTDGLGIDRMPVKRTYKEVWEPLTFFHHLDF